VRCSACGHLDSKVIDSRQSDDGGTIRRRRQCLACGHRFTTFERPETVVLMVIKRSGDREPFDRAKVIAGLNAAVKARPVAEGEVEALAAAPARARSGCGGALRLGVQGLRRPVRLPAGAHAPHQADGAQGPL